MVEHSLILGIVIVLSIGPAISIGFAVWGYFDAKKRDCNEVLVAVMFFFLGPIALLIWMFRRQPLMNEPD